MTDTEFARAKVNLFLHVTGRRADGYHVLDSLAIFPPVGDVLELEPASAFSLRITGPFASGLDIEQNLVLRAARLFAEATGHPHDCAFALEKNLPVASGIGGGSADAAAALRLLARHWNTEIPRELALRLGADVPVCLGSRPARMSGIGEIIARAPPLPDFGIVLVNPGLAVSTPAIFQTRTGAFSPVADLASGWENAETLVADLSRQTNDLEPPAIALAPKIAEVLGALGADENCLLARMSGSGATCFGLFRSPQEATEAAAALARPGWWVWAGWTAHSEA